MRGLFFKIFAIFWIAQSLIFAISTALIVRQRFVTPNIAFDALYSNLRSDAERSIHAFEAGGCDQFIGESLRYQPSSTMLLDESGKILCSTPNTPSIAELDTAYPRRISGRQAGERYVWTVPTQSASGKKYQYFWFQPHTPKRPARSGEFLHFAFPQLPVAIAVGGVTTFALVLLFTRPLVRLRRVARQLAEGNLKARVGEASTKKLRPGSDEFAGLVHDFNYMAERLELLVDAQKLLLRDVSHELRSPLTRLNVALELARDSEASDSEVHLNRIERETEKLNQLIGQLLTLSSIEARENTSAFEPVSLNQVCEELLPDAEYEAQQRPCSVILQQEAECMIKGNWELLHRAIENVIRNAIRYTNPETQVTIRISTSGVGTGKCAVVEVTDCGPGIPEDELTAIFRPFYRVDQARSFTTGGSGVGLAITERAVRLHGGSLRAANRETGGASVTMEFPILEMRASESQQIQLHS